MTGPMNEIFVPPMTRKGRIRRRRNQAILVIVALFLGAGTGWAADTVWHTCGWLGSGVSTAGGECVGVTDGSYVFDPAFEQVQKKIADENAWVRTQPSYVSVALLGPLTATPTSASSAKEILGQLEGAYTAQHRVNHTPVVGDSGPPIQLLLANEGSTEQQWQPVVEQLVEMAGHDNPLVAVFGMGLSIVPTKLGAEKLSEHGIPMIGSTIAAEELHHNRIPGLIRVGPTAQDYVKTLRGHIDLRDDLRSAIVVADSNSDSHPEPDLFTRSMRDAYRDNMADLITFPDQIFTGGGFPTTATPGVFATITPNICAAATQEQGLDVILYAGRRNDLDGFLTAMENRVCQDNPLTVMAAGIRYEDLDGREQRFREKNLSLVFSRNADPRGWGENAPETPDTYPAFLQVYTEAGFSPEHLMDDRPLMSHDALLTAAKAVRLAAPTAAPPGAPTARDVLGQMLNLNGLHRVPAVAGPLSFSSRAQGAGNPQGRSVLVFQFPSVTPGATPGIREQVGPTYITP